MSSPTETTALPDPLPAHLKALLELNREAEGIPNTWSRFNSREYLSFFFAATLCGFTLYFSHNAIVWFAGILSTVVTLHEIGERQARRRTQRQLQLLLTVIRGLERREAAAARS